MMKWGAERARHDARTEGHDGAFQCTSPCFRAFVLPGGPLRPGLPNGFAAVRTVPTDGDSVECGYYFVGITHVFI
jgi:hypothetical protein